MKFIKRFTGLVGSLVVYYDACKNCGATYKLLAPLPTHNSLKPPFALPLALSLASARHLHVLPLIMSPNLREENELEKKQQDKPSKASPGIGFKLLKKMGFRDGKGLGKYEDGILEPIMATKLPKYMGLGHAVQFIEDQPPSKKGNIDPGLVQTVLILGRDFTSFK